MENYYASRAHQELVLECLKDGPLTYERLKRKTGLREDPMLLAINELITARRVAYEGEYEERKYFLRKGR